MQTNDLIRPTKLSQSALLIDQRLATNLLIDKRLEWLRCYLDYSTSSLSSVLRPSASLITALSAADLAGIGPQAGSLVEDVQSMAGATFADAVPHAWSMRRTPPVRAIHIVPTFTFLACDAAFLLCT